MIKVRFLSYYAMNSKIEFAYCFEKSTANGKMTNVLVLRQEKDPIAKIVNLLTLIPIKAVKCVNTKSTIKKLEIEYDKKKRQTDNTV